MKSARVLYYFHQITQIPRESGKEEQIIEFLIDFAKKHKLEYKKDDAGNVVIKKSGTIGKENSPIIVLQSHSDMVCEKNSNSTFNFDTDPIKYVEENGWLIAKETTLGADCGIGIAAQLAILESNEIEHGPIEALFTTEEETGLTGAKSLKPGFITGNLLINLDSEDEGELFIGCAGGVDTTARFNYTPEPTDKNLKYYKVNIFGATGGHSGDDIEKERANANQLLFRYLYNLTLSIKFSICDIDGGNKRNAIAREAYAIIALHESDVEIAKSSFNSTIEEIKSEFSISDPELNGTLEESKPYETKIDESTAQKIIMSMYGVPHGVLAMSLDMKGLVETSTNLASIKIEQPGVIRVGTSQRSSVNSARFNAARRVESIFRLAGANVTHESEYPGWKPKLDSYLLRVTEQSYKDMFNKTPIVRAIHAGLECGMFLNIYPNLDMISFGPTIKGAHAPGERLELKSLDKFWILLLDVLKKIK